MPERWQRELERVRDAQSGTDLWARVEEGPHGSPSSVPHRQRLVAGLVAFAVFGAAALFAYRSFAPMKDQPATPAPSSAGPWASYQEGWSELPAPPEVRDGADLVWMGDRLLAWGGTPRGVEGAEPAADGFVFDPSSETWSTVAAAPVAGGGGDAVWTGSEVIFWGVQTPDGETALVFDPAAGSWRTIPGPPPGPRFGVAHVWTGSQLILFGGGLQGSATSSGGAIFDPSNDTWRVTLSAPIGMNLADAAWTGTEMIVIGSDLDNRNNAQSPTARAEAYDPATDTWRLLPDPPISPQTSAIAYVDRRVIAWEAYSPSAAEYLPDEDRWRSLDKGDLEGSECYAQGATVGDDVFAWNCGSPIAWFGQTASWVDIAPPLPATDTRPAYSFGGATAAGSAVVVQQVESTVGEGGGPEVGFPDAPVHVWLWLPPSVPLIAASTSPTSEDAQNLVGAFLDVWSRDIEPYIPTYVTADMLAKLESGSGGLDPFQTRPFKNWIMPRLGGSGDGTYQLEATITLKNEQEFSVVFDVGPGVTADGRDTSLVVTDITLGAQ